MAARDDYPHYAGYNYHPNNLPHSSPSVVQPPPPPLHTGIPFQQPGYHHNPLHPYAPNHLPQVSVGMQSLEMHENPQTETPIKKIRRRRGEAAAANAAAAAAASAAAAAAAQSPSGASRPVRSNPHPGIVVKTKFPVARIKRIMQADEDVGKVAQVTPVIVCKLPYPSPSRSFLPHSLFTCPEQNKRNINSMLILLFSIRILEASHWVSLSSSSSSSSSPPLLLSPLQKKKKKKSLDLDRLTPRLSAKALELFMIALCAKASEQARVRSSKRITASHLKQAILAEEQFDFLQEIMAKVPDQPLPSENSNQGNGSDEEQPGEGAALGSAKKPRKPRTRKPKDDDSYWMKRVVDCGSLEKERKKGRE